MRLGATQKRYGLMTLCDAVWPQPGHVSRRCGFPDAPQRMPPISHTERSWLQLGQRTFQARDEASMASPQLRGRMLLNNRCTNDTDAGLAFYELRLPTRAR